MMSDIAIRVQDLGKQYTIGAVQEQYRTLRESLGGLTSLPGRTLRSLRSGNSIWQAKETIWALRDVSFEVKAGLQFTGQPGITRRTDDNRMAIISTGQNFCSDLSLQAGEPLIGTATPTRVYLLLEYNGVWGEKALEESELPEAVKAHLKAYSKSSPDTKALLIKRRGAARESGIRFFVGTAAEGNPSLYSFRLDRLR